MTPDTQTANLQPGDPGWITYLIAAACGLIAANLYFAQPLIGLIGPELGLSPAEAGLIVTMTQLGYGLGLLFVVPLGDLFENRRLILTVLALGIVSALGLALARTPSIVSPSLLFDRPRLGLGADPGAARRASRAAARCAAGWSAG